MYSKWSARELLCNESDSFPLVFNGSFDVILRFRSGFRTHSLLTQECEWDRIHGCIGT